MFSIQVELAAVIVVIARKGASDGFERLCAGDTALDGFSRRFLPLRQP
jgi:hypothetical protein